MFDHEQQVPLSRFRRELNSWMRFFEKNPEKVIILTRNNITVSTIVSPSRYKNIRSV